MLILNLRMNLFFKISELYISPATPHMYALHFGLTPDQTAQVWDMLPIQRRGKHVHLLWALYFLKRYEVIEIAASFFEVDGRTFKEHVTDIINLLFLHLPKLPSDFHQLPCVETLIGSVDVTRCRINKPQYQPWQYWSGKDKFYALKYEVVVSTKPKRIIWVNGPYKGAFSDISIFRHRLSFIVPPTKLLLGDKGYIGESSRILAPYKGSNLTADQRRLNYKISRIRQDIERVNKRLKDWKLMEFKWRSGDYIFHGICVNVISRLLNLQFEINPL